MLTKREYNDIVVATMTMLYQNRQWSADEAVENIFDMLKEHYVIEMNEHQQLCQCAADLAYKEHVKETKQNTSNGLFYKIDKNGEPTFDVEKVLLKHERELMDCRLTNDSLLRRVKALENKIHMGEEK